MCTEDHENHEEITLDGLPVDVPDCELTSEAFGRLKCAFFEMEAHPPTEIFLPGFFSAS